MSTDSNPSHDNEQVYKTCSGCGNVYPLTFEFWYHQASNKDGFKTQCRQCVNAHGAKWAERNREKHLENRRNWGKKNQEKARAWRRGAYQKKKAQYYDRYKQWANANPFKVRVIKRRYYEKKRRTEREFSQLQLWTTCPYCNKEYPPTEQLWYRCSKKLPMICKSCYEKLDGGEAALLRKRKTAYQQRRRARKMKAGGSHTADQVNALLAQQQGKCFHCSIDISTNYQEDHWIPLSKGGSDWIENIRLLCPYCNQSKGAKLPHEWHPEKYPPPK